MRRYLEQEKELNFAFLFASPLVLSSDNQTKLMPTLKYDKEFDKIR